MHRHGSMPIAPFPHRYTVTLAGGQLAAPPRPDVPTGAPPQFGGRDDVWSPEELLVGAALSCLESTFAAYARRAGLTIHAWRGDGVGTLVKAAGGPVFSSIDLTVAIETEPGQEARVAEVLGEAERACIVSRALTVPVHARASVTAAGRRAG